MNGNVNVNLVGDLVLNTGITCDTQGGAVWPQLHKTGTGTLLLSGDTNNTN